MVSVCRSVFLSVCLSTCPDSMESDFSVRDEEISTHANINVRIAS